MALRRNKKTEHALWRPDFRNAEALPDIKVIRTDFLLNLVAISLAIALLAFFAFREYRAYGLSNLVDDLTTNIATNEAQDRANVERSKEFANLQKSMEEVIRFDNVPVDPSALLAELAAIQPDSIILERVNFSGAIEKDGKKKKVLYTLVLGGTVEHSEAHPASAVITDYLSALEEMPALQSYFLESAQPGFDRNESLGLFLFTIRVTLSDVPVKQGS